MIGLAIIKQESSFGNRMSNPRLDERNEANPCSAHFNDPKRWPTGCAKNALLIEDPTGKYDSNTSPSCSTKGYRLPTFRESALAAASTIQRKGLRAYSETAEYKPSSTKG
jgi:hypothetical protein